MPQCLTDTWSHKMLYKCFEELSTVLTAPQRTVFWISNRPWSVGLTHDGPIQFLASFFLTVTFLLKHLSFFNIFFVCLASSNCCFLTSIQVSQESGQVVWYSHLFQNFPQFIVIHTVKGFSIVNKAEIDVFWTSLTFLMIQWMLAIWCLVPLPFLKSAWISGCSRFMYCWSLAWRILSITLLACEMSAIVW